MASPARAGAIAAPEALSRRWINEETLFA